MSKDNGIWKCLDCSTGAITRAADNYLNEAVMNCKSLSRNMEYYPIRVTDHEYGYILFLSTDKDTQKEIFKNPNVPKSVKDVIRLAYKKGCNLINFDRDGFDHDQLPAYDWTAETEKQ